MSVDYIHGVEVYRILTGSRPVKTSKLSVVGICGTAPDADANMFPLNTPVKVTSSRMMTALGVAGTLQWALDGHFDNGGGLIVVVRVEEDADETKTLANVVGNAGDLTGVHAFKATQSLLGLTPRILIATGWTHQRPGDKANPVAAELKGIIKSLKAIAYIDGANGTDAQAIATVAELGDARMRLIDPWCTVYDTETASTVFQPLSARAAGRRAWIDREHGIHFSLSNFPIDGITGLGRPIAHIQDDPNGQTNLLNGANVTTAINVDGFRFWGNTGTGSDAKLQFQTTVRVKDMVKMNTQKSYNWAMDKPQSAQLYLDVVGAQNAYLRELKSLGIIYDGRAWYDEELNNGESVQDGRGFINFDLAVSSPLNRLTFTMYDNDGYYEEFAERVIEATTAAA